MNNRNRISSRKKKKKRSHYVLRPIDGVREYYSEAAMAAAFVGTLPMAVIRIIMSGAEIGQSGSALSILAAVGMAMMCGGLLPAFILALLGRRTAIFSAASGLVSAIGAGLVIPSELARLIGSIDVLGALENVCMLAFLCCLCVLPVSLFISALGVRTAPSLGTAASVAFIIAGMTYIFRAATSFSSLLTALGKNYNWDNTKDLASAKLWILRTVPEDSEQARRMVTISLLFAVSVLLAMLMSIAIIFRFRQHFEDFNKRMLISVETLRDSGYFEQDEDDGFDDLDDEEDDDDYYDGIETLERTRYEAEKHEEMRRYRQESERVHREAAFRTARRGDYQDEFGIYDEIEQSANEGSRGSGEHSGQFGETPRRGSGVQRDARQAVKVKVRTVSADDRREKLPDPDDASIWDHYSD